MVGPFNDVVLSILSSLADISQRMFYFFIFDVLLCASSSRCHGLVCDQRL